MKKYITEQNIRFLGFITTIVAFSGSLYLSNVLGFPPCVLCWYQRITLFPQLVLWAGGYMNKTSDFLKYSLPLLGIGWIISLYHNLLYYKIIGDEFAPCATGVSCTTKYIELFGFLTIPLMSFIAHSILLILVIWLYKKQKNN